MSFKLPINVRETTVSTGTGNIVPNGAVSGSRRFIDALNDQDTIIWMLAPANSVEREIHKGVWDEVTGWLVRSSATLIESTTGALINLPAGTHEVFVGDAPNKPVHINAQTGTAYTLSADDDTGYTCITLDNASAVTLTVPDDAVVISIGATIVLQQKGAGQVTVAAAAGVTINSEGGKLKLASQWAGGTLLKTAANTWWLTGSLAA